MPVIPKKLLSDCKMKRVICHWSEGNYKANETDLAHYHILIEGDGSVRGGDHSIKDNVSTADDNYAAHTRGANTGSIGVSCCCMVGCAEKPFGPGRQAMKQSQWEVMVQAVAELCQFYDIPVTPETVLGHGEVQKNLKIAQRGKWDPMVWPWDITKSRADVGRALREEVARALAALSGVRREVPLEQFAIMESDVGAYELRSVLLASDPMMQKIARTALVLIPPQHSQRFDGVAVIQEALNRLAAAGAALPLLDFGANNKYQGFYGPQTVKAIRAFQRQAGIGVDGRVGDETLRALDEALLGIGVAARTPVITLMPVAPSEIVPGLGAPVGSFTRPPANSKTKDGEGASTTTGLSGNIYQPQPTIEVVSAVETLSAKRDGRSLGAPRSVHQLRVIDSEAKVTNVEQSDYCWGNRELPGAALYIDFSGFEKGAAVVKGEASYFGKFDPIDEGTGTPIFGTVQTNSSVFGVSLPENLLLEFGLAQRKGKTLARTENSHTALVEIYFPKLKRMVRAPIVDVGPKGSVKRPVDLTVAVAAFLQDEPEEKARGYKLKNIQIQLRVV